MIARGAVCLNRARTVLRRGGGSNAVRLLHRMKECTSGEYMKYYEEMYGNR